MLQQKLNTFMKIPGLKDYFEKELGQPTLKRTIILCLPALFNNIYKECVW